jgi:hypothetical protein
LPTGERRPVRFADLGAIQDALEDMEGEYLECRDYQHSWRPLSAARNEDGTFTRTRRCSRCGTRKEETLSGRGAILSGRYIYPVGYLVKGLGRIAGEGRDALRLASVTRLMDTGPAKHKHTRRDRKGA